LIKALGESPPSAVLAAAALATQGGQATQDALFAALANAGPQLRSAAATSLLALGDERGRKPLLELLSEPRHQTTSALALAAHGADAGSLKILRNVFTETPPWKGHWLDAATGLAAAHDEASTTTLLDALKADDASHQASAAVALAKSGNAAGQEFLSNLVADARSEGRGEAALVLASLGNADAELFVPVGLMSEDASSQIVAIAVLSKLGGPGLRKQAKRLVALAASDAPEISIAALAALTNCPD